MGSAILAITPQHTLYANKEFLELTGYSEKDLSLLSPWRLAHSLDRSTIDRRLLPMLRRGDTNCRLECRGRKKNGEHVWVELRASRIDFEGEDSLLLTITDISRHKTGANLCAGVAPLAAGSTAYLPEDARAMDEGEGLRELDSSMLNSQKMATIGRLAGGVAHDFNNLLTVILNCGSLMLGSLAPNSRLHAEAEEIVKAAGRAASLTKQMLNLSKDCSDTPRVLSLNEVVHNVEGMITHLVGGGIKVDLSLDENIDSVHADAGQIEQVLLNLAANARDAMQGRGLLRVRSCNGSHPSAGHTGEPGVLLEISDTGCGMSAETLAHIYEPFYTTKSNGTGLGLATVYYIMHECNGDIWAESTPGRGSCFRLWFPAVAETEAVLSEPESCEELPEFDTDHSILLVEDEGGIRRLMTFVLESEGYTVSATAGGEEAMELAAGRDLPFDLLVTDVELPGMQGVQVEQQIRALFPQVQVLYISGYPEEMVRQPEAIDPGAPFLQKPFTSRGLLQKIGEILQSGGNSSSRCNG